MKFKKALCVFLISSMLLGALSGCGSPDPSDTQETGADSSASAASEMTTLRGKPLTKVGVLVYDMSSEFYVNIVNSVKDAVQGTSIQVLEMNAEGNVAKQNEQIENCITAGCEALLVTAVDTEGITDALKRARDEGITVVMCASAPSDQDAFDAIANVDQIEAGRGVAQACADWIAETYPDAEDRSIEVALVVNTGFGEEANKRNIALNAIEELCPAAKIVETYDVVGTTDYEAKTQEYIDLMLVEHPDVKAILCYAFNYGVAADEVIVNSGIPLDSFGIFVCDYANAVLNAINECKNGNGTLRSTVAFGVTFGKTMLDTAVGAVPLDDNRQYNEPCFIINTDNIDEYFS